ncbi:hypothetical protein [Abyssalbus ytuae]|uniref:Uncharacterized protein n=1 Tax=Abyssalbus ytuae TaxID=2926907 RepID=A0A9E7D4G3_9FLAO|nr:hypothetical protein [Abyssalbus ytuae]UOB18894.1 hypothetical protein MQE35_06250 [Abyssalbus ytuae]
MDTTLDIKKKELIKWILSVNEEEIIEKLFDLKNDQKGAHENIVNERVKNYKSNPNGLIDLDRRPNGHR